MLNHDQYERIKGCRNAISNDHTDPSSIEHEPYEQGYDPGFVAPSSTPLIQRQSEQKQRQGVNASQLQKKLQFAVARKEERLAMENEELKLAEELGPLGDKWATFIDSNKTSREKIRELNKALNGQSSEVPDVLNKRLLECARYRFENLPRSREGSTVQGDSVQQR